jgi:hypothetical protein
MRRTSILAIALAVAGLSLAAGVLPAAAQDILGLSLRPTQDMPSGTAPGSADIVASDGGKFVVSVDVSGAADNLKLDAYQGAKAFVVWAVDMNGVRHNLGALDKSLVLDKVPAGYPVAMLYVTAEPDVAITEPTGKQLFRAVLRNVEESSNTATPAAGGASAAAATTGPTTAAAASTAAPQPTAATATAKKPVDLPKTGTPVQDLLVLSLVALALVLAGLRIRTVRL